MAAKENNEPTVIYGKLGKNRYDIFSENNSSPFKSNKKGQDRQLQAIDQNLLASLIIESSQFNSGYPNKIHSSFTTQKAAN